MTRKLIELINSDCNSRESVLTVQQISKLFYNAIKIIFKYTNAMRTFFKLKICNTYWISCVTHHNSQCSGYMCEFGTKSLFYPYATMIPIQKISHCNNLAKFLFCQRSKDFPKDRTWFAYCPSLQRIKFISENAEHIST